MKQLNGKITLTYRQNKDTDKHDLHIKIRDEQSRMFVAEIKVDADNVSELFSSLYEIPMSYEILDSTDKLGRSYTNFTVTLNLPEGTTYANRDAVSTQLVQDWHSQQENKENIVPSFYFGSKSSYNRLPGGTETVTFGVREFQ
jgi:hypothetical protein